MKRDLAILANTEFDVVIVGGGIFGVCAAWDASLRGLSVALVEKDDFGHATSANHFKIVHGGIRYLQHGDVYRIRESSKERSALLRVAPHLVQPLPIVIPTYGHGTKGKEILGMGLFLYDMLTADRNSGIRDPDRRVQNSYFMPPNRVLQMFPGIEKKGLTGGAVFYDGQMYNPPRLAICFLRSAVEMGAAAANYVEVTGFLKEGERVVGVKAQDILTRDEFRIRGKVTLNTAGPWAHRLLERGLGLSLTSSPTFSRDLAFVINRRLDANFGLALSTNTKDADSVLARGGRHLFIVPWRDHGLVGVWHQVFPGSPEEIDVSEADLNKFTEEINGTYANLDLRVDDITMVNTGLTLFGDEHSQGQGSMSFGKRSLFVDHGREHKLEGLITLIGVRATTSRGMAERACDLILRKLRKKAPKSGTSFKPIYGGQIDCFDRFLHQAIDDKPAQLDARTMCGLVRNYGSKFREVMKYVQEDASLGEHVGNGTTVKAEIVHAVREEMAQKLSDVVLRRTDLGTGGNPGMEALEICGCLMGKEMGWSDQRVQEELAEVRKAFPPFNKKYLDSSTLRAPS